MAEDSLNVEQAVRDVEPHLEQQQLLQSLSLRDDLLHNLEQKLGQWETVVRVKEKNMETKEKLLERLRVDNERLKKENKEKTKKIKNLEDTVDKQAVERKKIVEEVKKLVVVLEQEYSEDKEGTKTNYPKSLHKDISVEDKEISKLRINLDNTRKAIKQLEHTLEGNLEEVNKQTETAINYQASGSETELQNALQKVEETEDKYKSLEEECRTLKCMLENTKIQNQAEVNSTQEKLRKKNDEETSHCDVNQHESILDKHGEESVAKIVGRVAELEGEKINLQQELDRARSDLHTSQLENKKTVNSLQEKLEKQAENMHELTTPFDLPESNVGKLGEEYDEKIVGRVAELESEKINLQQELDRARSDLHTSQLENKKTVNSLQKKLEKQAEDINKQTENMQEMFRGTQSELQNALSKIKETEDEKKRLEDECNILKGMLENIKTQNITEVKEKTDEPTSLSDLPESNVGKLGEEYDEKMVGRVAELESEKINLQQELDRARSDLHTSQLENKKTVNSLQETLEKQAEDINKKTENMQEMFRGTQSELQNALSKIKETEDEKKRLEDECNILKGMLENIKTQNITEVKEKTDEPTSLSDLTESNVGKLGEEYDEKMVGRVAELESEKINLQQELDRARSDLHTSQLENKITVNSLQETLEKQAEDINKQTENMQMFRGTQSELQIALSKIKETEDEKKRLEDECNILKGMLENIKTQNITEVKEKTEELTSPFDLPESNVSKLGEEYDEKMVGRVAELESEKINLQQKLDRARSDLDTSQLENKKTVNSLQETLEKQAEDINKQTENMQMFRGTQSELQNALSKIKETEDEKKRFEDECNILKGMLENIKTQNITEVKEKTDELKSTFDLPDSNVGKLGDEYDEKIVGRVAELESEKINLQQELDRARSDLHTSQLENKKTVNSLQETLEKQAEDINKQTENMQEMFRGTQSELQNALSKIKETEDEKKRLEDECNILKGRLENIKPQNQTEVNSLQEDLRKKNDDNDETSRFDLHESNGDNHEGESYQEIVSHVAKLECKTIALERELDKARSDLEKNKIESQEIVKSLKDDVKQKTKLQKGNTIAGNQQALNLQSEQEQVQKHASENQLNKSSEKKEPQSELLEEELKQKTEEVAAQSNRCKKMDESADGVSQPETELHYHNEDHNHDNSLRQAVVVQTDTPDNTEKVADHETGMKPTLTWETKELEENNDQLKSSLGESETRIEEVTPTLEKAGQERQPHASNSTGSVTNMVTKFKDDTQNGDTSKISENSTIPKEDEVGQTIESLRHHNEKNQKIINDKDSKIKETQQRLDSALEAIKKLYADKSRTETELKNAKSSINNLSSENELLQQKITDQQTKLCANGVKIQETLNKSAVLEDELKQMETQHNECTKKWIQDRNRTDEAVELKQRAEAELRKIKATVHWKLAKRLTVEQQSKMKMRGHLLLSVREISGEIVELKEHITSLDQEHQITLGIIQGENSQLKEDLQGAQEETRTLSDHLIAAQEETKTLTAHYTEKDQEKTAEMKNLHDQITHYSFKVEELKGEVAIAHAWVNKMSEQCAQSEANKGLLSRQLSISEGLLQEKEQQCQELRGEVAERERQMEHLRNEIHIWKDRQRVFDDRIQHASTETTELRGIVALLKDEIDKAERALRQAYRQDEERFNELKKKEEEKQRLIRDILYLRRQLDSMRLENEQFRVNCNQLRAELHGYLNAH